MAGGTPLEALRGAYGLGVEHVCYAADTSFAGVDCSASLIYRVAASGESAVWSDFAKGGRTGQKKAVTSQKKAVTSQLAEAPYLASGFYKHIGKGR